MISVEDIALQINEISIKELENNNVK